MMIWIVIFRMRGFTNLVLNACSEPLSLFVCFFFFKCQTFPFIPIQICICLDRFLCFPITKIFGSSVDYRHRISIQPISKPPVPMTRNQIATKMISIMCGTQQGWQAKKWPNTTKAQAQIWKICRKLKAQKTILT